jgi:hypothetical protein
MKVPRLEWMGEFLGPKMRVLEMRPRPMEIEELQLRQMTEWMRE